MAEEITPNTAKIEMRTVALSQKLLKQFRTLQWHMVPAKWFKEDGKTLLDERVVGWIHSSVFADEFGYARLLLNNGRGDYFLVQVDNVSQKLYKQLYIA